MKISLIVAGSLLVLAVTAFGLASHLHSGAGENASHVQSPFSLHGGSQKAESPSGPATLSIAQNDFDLCTDGFYVGFYELSKALYADSSVEVTVARFEQETFNYIRSWDKFTPQEAEGWVEHIKAIPGQMIEIIQEDPGVLDSCANFSVALVGPP